MKKSIKLALVAFTGVVAGAAHAAGSPAETAIASIGTEASALATAAWPVVTAIVVAFIGMKLFKKFANKAT